MRCPRCNGTVVKEAVHTVEGSFERGRCIQSGRDPGVIYKPAIRRGGNRSRYRIAGISIG